MKRLLTSMLLLAVAAGPHADEFGGMPGLWLTTLTRQGDAAAPPETEWHCVDENGDPWMDYARQPEAVPPGCSRTSFERTATSLRWQLACGAPVTVTTTGSIVFDAETHYTGNVVTEGKVDGFPMRAVTRVEGTRRAACTSPSD